MQVTPPLPLYLFAHHATTPVSEPWRQTHGQASKGGEMVPNESTVEKAKEDLREGKAPTTAAGEFVHEEIEHVRHGKHGARLPQQAIAIGLSKARRAGIPLKPPRRGRVKEKTRRSVERAYRKGQAHAKPPRRKYSRIRENVMKREPRGSASHRALSRQARRAAAQRHKRTHHRTAGRRRHVSR